MTMPALPHSRRRFWNRPVAIGMILAFVAVLVLANGHLVYVAFTSQPDCVPHLKHEGSSGAYQAAKSAC